MKAEAYFAAKNVADLVGIRRGFDGDGNSCLGILKEAGNYLGLKQKLMSKFLQSRAFEIMPL